MNNGLKIFRLTLMALFAITTFSNCKNGEKSETANQFCKVENGEYTFHSTANPYLPLWEHVPDGEPRVFEDPDNPGKFRIYIIGSHDVQTTHYCGLDTKIWSAPVEDLSQWHDEGSVFTYETGGKYDVMYAPDLVEVKRKNGKKEYYLYPHSRGHNRVAMVAKSDCPDGPFIPINVSDDGKSLKEGSILGFDPAVYIEYITDENDPDYKIGFRAYGYWGFKHSQACELDQNTMYSIRPGTEMIDYFIPSGKRYGEINDPEGTQYPNVVEGEDLGRFNFFEAASIRKIGNKYVWIYSGYSGPEYGLGSSNSALRYAYGDSPLGPWKSGGVLVDSRAPVLSQNGDRIEESGAGHNTHGSIELINNQWYVFYHRSPRSFGYARQAMVAPVTIKWDEKSVAEGGNLTIRAYNPYANDKLWTAKASNNLEYKGAEVTSEGFHIFGLNPYQYYSAGYACYLSNRGIQSDSWDVWDNNMPLVNVKNGNIIGYKYFGFGGLNEDSFGLKAFAGTKPGNKTTFNVWATPKTKKAFKINVWFDGPWDNDTWKGTKIGEITIPANSTQEITQYTVDVADAVDNLDKKHAIFLTVEADDSKPICDIIGLGFSSKNLKIARPVAPTVSISVNGNELELPNTPVRATPENGLVDYNHYVVEYKLPANTEKPKVTALSNCNDVKISVNQETDDYAEVCFDYNGVVKVYNVVFK